MWLPVSDTCRGVGQLRRSGGRWQLARSDGRRTGEQLPRLVDRSDAPAERADELGRVGNELGIRRCEDAAAEVDAVLEPDTDPAGASQDRQREHSPLEAS